MDNVIQERIKLQIKKSHSSAKEMLEKLNLNPGFITDIGRKGAYPAADKLLKIAIYLDVSIDYLVGRTDKPEVNK